MDNREFETRRKYNEYKMRLIKMAGSLSDYYIDRAIESNDYSELQDLLIEYFFEHVPSRLVSEYKKNELDKKIEDMDIDLGEWQRLRWEVKGVYDMTDQQYISEMTERRKNEPVDENDTI